MCVVILPVLVIKTCKINFCSFNKVIKNSPMPMAWLGLSTKDKVQIYNILSLKIADFEDYRGPFKAIVPFNWHYFGLYDIQTQIKKKWAVAAQFFRWFPF